MTTVAEFLGEDQYLESIIAIGRGFAIKGSETPVDTLLYSLELQLGAIEVNRRQSFGERLGHREDVHEGLDFLVNLAQTLPALSPDARERLRRSIFGALKTEGLRPLQHELRVARALAGVGCELQFHDQEGGGGFDYLATRDGVTYEVEAKAMTMFSGEPAHPKDAGKLFVEIRLRFVGWAETDPIPVLNVTLPGRVPASKEALIKIADGCSEAVRNKRGVVLNDGTSIAFDGTLRDVTNEELRVVMERDAARRPRDINVFAGTRRPRVYIRLFTAKPMALQQKLREIISSASRRQCTQTRPAVLWPHIDYLTPERFVALIDRRDGLSMTDGIAASIFNSTTRGHLTQLVFSGVAVQQNTEETTSSGYRVRTYNSKVSRFNVPPLFPWG